MAADELHFLLSDYTDRQTFLRRRGESLVLSILFHVFLILLVLFGPLLLFPPRKLPDNLVRQELTRLDTNRPEFLPLPEEMRQFKKPRTPILSDKDRMAQGKAPMIDPRGRRAPYSEGDTKAMEQAAKEGQPVPPVTPPAATTQPQGESQEGLTKGQAGLESKMPLPAQPVPDGNKTVPNFRDMLAQMETPGNSIRNSLEEALKRGKMGSGGIGAGSGNSIRTFDNRQPNFSVDEPTILTDTRGVDFGPWLRIVYFRVRDNWYSVIPELIRSGARGKAVLIFDVSTDGRVANLQLAKTSGIPPYDRAAISSIKLSEPFPNFPPSFTGDRITLQFSYFYNIRI